MHIHSSRKNQRLPPQPNAVYYTHSRQLQPFISPALRSPKASCSSRKNRSRDSPRGNHFQDIFRIFDLQTQRNSRSRQKIPTRKIKTQQSPLGRMLCEKAIEFYEDEVSKHRPVADMYKRKQQLQKHIKIEIQNNYRSSYEAENDGNGILEWGSSQEIRKEMEPSCFQLIHKTESYHFGLEKSSPLPPPHSNYSQNNAEINGAQQNQRQEKQNSNSLGYSCELKLQSNFSLSDRRSSRSKSSESISLKLKSLKLSISNPMMTQTLEKIEIHLTSINYLAQYADWMEEFYKDESEWEVAKYLVYSRFSYERQRVYQSLIGNDNCFHLKDLEIAEFQLRMLISNYSQLRDFTQTIRKQNQKVRECLEKIQLNLTRKNIRITDSSPLYLYNEVNREFRILGDLLDKGVSAQQQQIYKQRMVSIIQIVFLIQELEGRYVRRFLQAQEMCFRDYMNEAYLDYNSIVTNKRR